MGAAFRLACIASVAFGATALAQTGRPSRRVVTIHDRYAAIADTVPGFAGLYVSGDSVIVMLVDPKRLRAATRALQRLSADFPQGRRHIVAGRARYDFRQLYGWKVLSRGVLNHPGVSMLGIKHARNAVYVGVVDSVHVEPVRAALVARGIPADAVFIQVMGPFRWRGPTPLLLLRS